METIKLAPTEVTESSKYYQFKEGELTSEILKNLIPDSITEMHKIDFCVSKNNGKECILIHGNKAFLSTYNIALDSVYEVKVQENVCISISSIKFNITLFTEVGYISLLIF